MNPTATTHVAPALATVRRRLEAWRGARTHPSPIPEPLWAAAVALAQQHGLDATAQALRLNVPRLRQRLEAADRASRAATGLAFVELAPPLPATSSACVIELTGPRGGTMRIELTHITLPDVAALCRVVWSGDA